MSAKARTKRGHQAVGGRKRSVRYLRVSTPSQVNTDYNPEGISLPAQRVAAQRKEHELEADNVGEYVEPGRTATSIEKRPVFQEMLARIKAEKDVDYIIVYHFNRIFRNSIDAAITKRELARYGVRVVSTVLDLGESPESSMVETIMHAVDQYRSEADGADIRYKMGQKAKTGGTITKAPLGYLNERIDIDGRTVAVSSRDPERASHVVHGFELYGTGQYSARQVLDRLNTAGLRTRGTHKTPPRSLSPSQFYVILADPYYKGVIEYAGEEFKGRHDPLISAELFERVQRVLALHGGGGTRQRTHNHYLKGALWCGRCGRRLVVMPGRGNGGTYFYYLCRGRQDHACDQPYVRIETLEDAVTRHYATVRLSDEFCTRVRALVDDVVLSELGSLDLLRKRLTARLKELDTKEDQYLDLVGEAGWPKAKLQRKLDGIQAERDQIRGQVDDTGTRLEVGRQFFLAALALLRDPQAFYEQGGTSLRQAMNKLIFAKLYVDAEEISGHELAETVRDLVTADRTLRGSLPAATTPNASSPVHEDEAAWSNLTGAVLLGVALAGHGSSKTALVGDTGIEPVTSSVSTRSTSAADMDLWLSALVGSLVLIGLRKPWRRPFARSSPRFLPGTGSLSAEVHPARLSSFAPHRAEG